MVDQAADQGLRPDPAHVEAVRETAQLLTDLGHDVVEVNPRYPDATLAFVPQFFAGVRTESDAVEHYDKLEKRTRETYRLGSWVRPGVVQWALRAGEKVAAKANRVFAGPTGSTCCSPRRSPTGHERWVRSTRAAPSVRLSRRSR